MLLDRDSDGELGSGDLFYWLNAPAGSSRPSIKSAGAAIRTKRAASPRKGFASVAAAATAAAAAAAPPPLQPLVESLVRVRGREAKGLVGSEAEGEPPSVRVGLQTFTDAWAENMDALPMPRPYAAALGWLRREMGEVDLAAVEAMKDLPTEILRSITSKQGKLISLFLKWDKDGNGRVDRAEMLAALTAEEHARTL